jgi:iron-sulfur cluster assembly accessory protein
MITITDKAAKELNNRVATEAGAIGVRLTITTTGCSGHSYKMEHVFEKSEADDEYEHNGARLFIPIAQSLNFVGTEIDYLEDRMESRFDIRNPNADNSCGCGESFSLKENRP